MTLWPATGRPSSAQLGAQHGLKDGLPVLMPETHAGLQHSAAKTTDLREFLAARGSEAVPGQAEACSAPQASPEVLQRRQGTGRTVQERVFNLRWAEHPVTATLLVALNLLNTALLLRATDVAAMHRLTLPAGAHGAPWADARSAGAPLLCSCRARLPWCTLWLQRSTCAQEKRGQWRERTAWARSQPRRCMPCWTRRGEARHAELAARRRAGTGRAPAARSFSIASLPALPPRTPPPPPPPPPQPAAESDVPMREATPAPVERNASASPSVDMLVEGLLERPGPLLPRTTPRRLSAGRRSWEVCAAAILGCWVCSFRMRIAPWPGSRLRQLEDGVQEPDDCTACVRAPLSGS